MSEEEKAISYPISKTGGRGFEFEDFVATHFLLAMLEGVELWGQDYGYITQVDWQTHADGWLFDDLLLTLKDHTGASHHVAISIKSNAQLTARSFPRETTQRIWQQFLEGAPPFDVNRDLLLFAVGEISSSVLSNWTDIHQEVSSADDKRISNRLAADGVWSKDKIELFCSLACPDKIKHDADLSICTIIRRLLVKSFDFLNATSDSRSDIQRRAINLCSTKSYSDGHTLLDKLLLLCREKRGSGGGVTLNDIYDIPDLPDLVTHPNYHRDIAMLQEISQGNVDLIQGTLSNGITIPRNEICESIKEHLTDKKIVAVTGQSGIGKSAIVKMIYSESPCFYKLWLSNKDFDIQRLNHPLVSVIKNLPTANALIVVDSAERLDNQHKTMLAQLISIAKRCGFCVILTTTKPLSISESMQVEVTPVTEDDLTEVFRKDKSLFSLWKSKGMNTLMCIPKILDWCIELLANSPMTTLDPVNFADYLWNKWIRSSADDKHLRAQVLKEIATFDGDSIKSGVSISQISDASILGVLEKDNLVYIKDELIFWKHDLIGDWAREKILVENKDDFLNFVKDKYHKPQWKHAILLFGQWLLNKPDGVDEWEKYVNSQKDELQSLLLDSVIFANRSFELCESIKSTLLGKRCKLFILLLDRLFLVASSKKEINGQLFPVLDLRLALPFLYFIDNYSKDIIPYCQCRISRMCFYFLSLGRGTQFSHVAALLAIKVAKFAYKNEKHIQVGKSHEEHLYLEDSELDEIWMSFLFAFQESPKTVMKYSLVFAEIEDPKDEELKSLLSSSGNATEIHSPVEQRYVPAWPNGPKRKVSRRFREACLSSSVLNPFFDKFPDEAARLLMAVCIEAPHYSSEFPHFWESYGLDMLDRTDHACCYFIGPWLQLLERHSNIALKIIIDLVNFATERFDARCKQDEQERTCLDSNSPLARKMIKPSAREITLLNENKKEKNVWIGDERVFGWHRNRLIDSPIIPTVLMALEKWLYDLVEKKENINSHIDYIFSRNKSVAIAGVLCSLVKKYPDLLFGKLKVLASAWQFLMWDMNVSIDDPWEIGFELYFGKLGEALYNKALEWNRMPHRKIILKDIVQRYLLYAVACGVDVTFFDVVVQNWKNQNLQTGPSQLLIAQMTPANYQKRRLSNGEVEVSFSYPSSLEQKVTDDAKESSLNISAGHFPFECRKIIEDRNPLPDKEAENIWNRMNEYADYIHKKTDSESDSDIGVVSCREIYCAGICALLHQNPDFIMRDESKRNWTIQTVFRIYNVPPSRQPFDNSAMHLLNSWDSFIGEISVLLYKHWAGDCNDTRELLARSLQLFHYAAIKASLACVRSELADEHTLIELINLHIKISFARGLLWLDERWKGYMLHDFNDIGNQKIYDYCNDFCAKKEYTGQITDIGKLHAEYLKIRNRGLQFDMRLMSQSNNILVRLYAKVKIKIRGILNHAAREFDQHETKNFKSIYESRFSREQICDFTQLSLVVDIVDFSDMHNFSYKNQLDLLIQIESLMLMPLRYDPNEAASEHGYARTSPDKAEISCLRKIANSLVLINIEDSRNLWQPILALDQCFHRWIDVFLSCFFHLKDKNNIKNFTITWKEMIEFANRHWDVKTHDAQNLLLRLFGIYNRDPFWIDDSFIPVIKDLTPLYLRWANRSIKNNNNINNYIAFCSSIAGAPLLKDSLLLIADSIESAYLRDNDETSILSAQLCKEIWTKHRDLIKGNHDLTDAFFRILSKTISLGSREALDLQKEITMSNI